MGNKVLYGNQSTDGKMQLYSRIRLLEKTKIKDQLWQVVRYEIREQKDTELPEMDFILFQKFNAITDRRRGFT